MKKYFLISNYKILNHRPEINKIDIFKYKQYDMWTCALNEIEPFIINTYDFSEYIFILKPKDVLTATVSNIIPFLSNKKIKHFVIKGSISIREKQEILYILNADLDLSCKIYFSFT